MATHVEIQSEAEKTWRSLDGMPIGGVPPRWVTAGKKLLEKIEDDDRWKSWVVVGDRVDLVPGWVMKDFGSDDGDLQSPQEWLKHRLRLQLSDIW
jgi:hypothetical protein